jgi:hypothetical protein
MTGLDFESLVPTASNQVSNLKYNFAISYMMVVMDFTCLVVEHEQVKQIEYRTMETRGSQIGKKYCISKMGVKGLGS